MNELKDLHTDRKICFTTMEAEGEGSNLVNSLLTVPRRHFHFGTFCKLLCIVSLSNIFFLIIIIMKTCLYNFDPLKPHFYIVKLGFIGVYIIFLISAQNIDCGYSLEPPR